MVDSRTSWFKFVLRIIGNLTLLLLVGIPVALFFVFGVPFKRGFFCSDDSIRYPYKESTVPTWLLYLFGLGLPLATIIVTEYAMSKLLGTKQLDRKSWLTESYHHVWAFLFGAGCTQLLTDITKYTIGRLRPHFIDVCIPDVDCNDPMMKNIYIENFVCRGKDAYLLKDMRLSFPSGHSTISAYSMVFLVMYCHSKMIRAEWNRVKCTLQYLAIVLALYTGLSRISDYKHHWSDVLAGFTLGTLTAVLIVLFVADLFPRRRSDDVRERASQSEGIALEEDFGREHQKYTVI